MRLEKDYSIVCAHTYLQLWGHSCTVLPSPWPSGHPSWPVGPSSEQLGPSLERAGPWTPPASLCRCGQCLRPEGFGYILLISARPIKFSILLEAGRTVEPLLKGIYMYLCIKDTLLWL